MTENAIFKQIRLNRKLNQTEFGSAIRMSQTGVAAIENGKNRVTDQIKLLLHLVFNVNPECWNGSEELFLPNQDKDYKDLAALKANAERVEDLQTIIKYLRRDILALQKENDELKERLKALVKK